MMRLSAIALWTRGHLHGADVEVLGVGIDTRKIRPGDLFVAIKGEHADGHNFLAQAAAAGAVAALVERRVDAPIAQVVVNDTQLALGDLASAVRAQSNVRVVGITGSNGKTTVKTLLASILKLHGKTHVNAGNLNNEIGLPLALLALPEDAQYAVFEMGAGKPGDIAYLAAIARPEIGLVNNIAPAHLERMGTLEGIAETKGTIYAALPPSGVAVVNADDAFAGTFIARSGTRNVISFGIEHAAEVSAKIDALGTDSRFELLTPSGNIELILPLPGRHNVMNALAASAAALALDVPLATIKQGLESAASVQGRLQRYAMPGGWTLIDDSYNANPASTAAAIATLTAEPGDAWLVLGDMRELGRDAVALHAQTGKLAREHGIARLYAVGELAAAAAQTFGKSARHFATQLELIAALRTDVHAGVRVLVKGSRGSAMERVVHALLGASNGGSGGGGARHAA